MRGNERGRQGWHGRDDIGVKGRREREKGEERGKDGRKWEGRKGNRKRCGAVISSSTFQRLYVQGDQLTTAKT